MMTEAEAKARWCPFANCSNHGDASSGNRSWDGVPDNPAVRCIGSRCMAWRWSQGIGIEGDTHKPAGYCGMAGKP